MTPPKQLFWGGCQKFFKGHLFFPEGVQKFLAETSSDSQLSDRNFGRNFYTRPRNLDFNFSKTRFFAIFKDFAHIQACFGEENLMFSFLQVNRALFFTFLFTIYAPKNEKAVKTTWNDNFLSFDEYYMHPKIVSII